MKQQQQQQQQQQRSMVLVSPHGGRGHAPEEKNIYCALTRFYKLGAGVTLEKEKSFTGLGASR